MKYDHQSCGKSVLGGSASSALLSLVPQISNDMNNIQNIFIKALSDLIFVGIHSRYFIIRLAYPRIKNSVKRSILFEKLLKVSN